MSERGVTESVVEQAALAWLECAGWATRNGAAIAPGEPAAERDDYGHVVLAQRLRDALARLNPALPAEALDDAFRKLTRPGGAELIRRNRTFTTKAHVDWKQAGRRAAMINQRASKRATPARFVMRGEAGSGIGPEIGPTWPDSPAVPRKATTSGASRRRAAG